MKLRLRSVSMGLLVLIALLATGALVLRRQGERALERKLAELRARGEKLTVRELFGASTPEDSARHQRFDSVIRQLRGAPNWAATANPMTLEQPGRAGLTWSNPGGVPADPKTAALLATWEAVALDLEGASTALDQLRHELIDPPRATGNDYDANSTVPWIRPDFVALRGAAFWLAGASIRAMHENDLNAVLTNLIALSDLSRAYRNEPTLVAHMIRVAIAGVGTATTWEALQNGTWSEPQLARLQAAVLRADATQDAARGIEGDRAWVFILGNNARTNQSPGPAAAVGFGIPKQMAPIFNAAWRGALAPRDLCLYLDRMQPYVDGARAIREGAQWSDVKASLPPDNEPQTTLAEWQRTYLTPFSAAAVPRMDKVLSTIARNETLRQMTLAAIAIRRYELRHGQPPPSLEALVPVLLPKLPHDCFSGQPLRYRRTGNGEFLLYSVGQDGQDDGGNTTPNTKAKSWTIWDAPDAVWPKPLEE